MLDEEHPAPRYDTHYDENTYICGTINSHAIVIATCGQGDTGNINTGRLTGSMFKTFPNIRMALLVGIGGGIPHTITPKDPLDDIHLGDVVVGWPGDGKPACVYYERGRARADGEFEMVGTIQDPDRRLINALSILVSDHEMGKTAFTSQLKRLQNCKKREKFIHPGLEHDRLYKSGYKHIGGYGSECVRCDPNELVQRPARTEDDKAQLVFHLGRIATGNAVIQDSKLRDLIKVRCGGALCIEMEAAGVDANRRCLVICGISDYADSHNGDVWRSHAAGKAAAFARELLCRVPSSPDSPSVRNAVREPPNRIEGAGSGNRLANTISTPQKSKNKDKLMGKGPKSGNQWSREEDEKLLHVVKTMGKPDWKVVALYFHRSDWACQQRHKKLMEQRNNP